MFSYTTGRIGGPWMEWHMRSGFCVLALLLFRLAWGIAGPRDARFASFVRGYGAARDYARQFFAGHPPRAPGHNPLGGWMVVAMLVLLLVQAGTGLFANDESSHEGPLASKVSNAMVDRASLVHGYNQWLVMAAVALHIVAIGWYQVRLGIDLTRAMVFGRSGGSAVVLALVFLAAAAAGVYWLVVVYPR